MNDPRVNETSRSIAGTEGPSRGDTDRSIGEVLAMLQSDYPDITVSKIRFLETQGLISPERTPSGYRKFHDHDVEQLRWILRQQKDNFLPLKVIKQRLAAGQLEGSGSAGVLEFSAAEMVDTGRDASPDATLETSTEAGPEAGPETGPETGLGVGFDTGAQSDRDDGHDREPASGHENRASAEAVGATSGRGSSEGWGLEAEIGGPPPGSGSGRTRPGVSELRRGEAPDRTHRRPTGSSASSVAMGASELCAAAGITRSFLSELERLGMVAGTDNGGVAVYGDDAFVVARLAGAMSTHGLEPRHLRGFKVAADREAGLYEQLAAPGMMRADPQARREAAEGVAALADLGARLHDALLNRALRADLRWQ